MTFGFNEQLSAIQRRASIVGNFEESVTLMTNLVKTHSGVELINALHLNNFITDIQRKWMSIRYA